MTDKKIASNNTYPSSRVAWSGVTVFTILYILSYADRKLLSLLVGPIQQDLNISDFQFGLLQGFAFSLLYVVAGIPIGRLVDRKPRRMIIYLGVTFWSICTASIGYAQNFVTLLLLRCGVGVGEATLSPASYSLMSDLFPKEKVTTAIGVYGTGVTIGGGIAFILGGSLISLINSVGGIDLGILGTFKAWQLAFLLAGVPGLFLAFLIFTVPEPKRMGVAKKSDVSKSELWGFMRTRKAFLLYHFIGFALVGTWSFSVSSWAPAFYGRKFGVSPMEMGIGLGIYTGIFGTMGAIVGSRLVDALTKRGMQDAQMRVCAWAMLAAIPFGIGGFLYPSAIGSFALLSVMQFFLMFIVGPAVGALQLVTPNQLRGQISAIYLFVVSIVGFGLGPVIVGALTDYVVGDPTKIGTSLILVILISGPASAGLLFLGLGPMRRAVEQAKQWSN